MHARACTQPSPMSHRECSTPHAQHHERAGHSRQANLRRPARGTRALYAPSSRAAPPGARGCCHRHQVQHKPPLRRHSCLAFRGASRCIAQAHCGQRSLLQAPPQAPSKETRRCAANTSGAVTQSEQPHTGGRRILSALLGAHTQGCPQGNRSSPTLEERCPAAPPRRHRKRRPRERAITAAARREA